LLEGTKRFSAHKKLVLKTVDCACDVCMRLKDSFTTPRKSDGSQSIRRAISIIRAVSKYNDSGARLTQVAKDVNLHIATTRRILNALNQEGFIGYDQSSKHYYLGIELFTLGTVANQFEIRTTYRPVLERIAEHTKETVFLNIRLGNNSLCIDRIEGSAPIRIMPYPVGTQTPLGAGSGELALIFNLPDKKIEQILTANEKRYRQYNAHDKSRIWEAVIESRRLKFSLSRELYVKGVGGVGCPIRSTDGQETIASISVCTLAENLHLDRCKRLASIIRHEIEALVNIVATDSSNSKSN